MSTTTPNPGTPEAGTPAPSPQTLDAQERIARLRAIADDFPDEASPKPLTKAERNLAARTSIVFVEKAALFAEAAPNIGVALSVDTAVLRDAVASELANGGVIDETRTLISRIEDANTRKKVKAVKVARGLYRVAKSYVTTDLGHVVTPHVDEMKRALQRPRAKKKTAPAEPPATTPAATTSPSDSTSQQK
ncbi:MAG TPA: hypothetical protein VNN25_22240 [Thermoanaerobaculia bacterium]|nr:hypothetical protein [Thermoanaerobaculia bacterium]